VRVRSPSSEIRPTSNPLNTHTPSFPWIGPSLVFAIGFDFSTSLPRSCPTSPWSFTFRALLTWFLVCSPNTYLRLGNNVPWNLFLDFQFLKRRFFFSCFTQVRNFLWYCFSVLCAFMVLFYLRVPSSGLIRGFSDLSAVFRRFACSPFSFLFLGTPQTRTPSGVSYSFEVPSLFRLPRMYLPQRISAFDPFVSCLLAGLAVHLVLSLVASFQITRPVSIFLVLFLVFFFRLCPFDLNSVLSVFFSCR